MQIIQLDLSEIAILVASLAMASIAYWLDNLSYRP